MKKRVLSLAVLFVFAFLCVGFQAACGKREVWTAPKRISLTLPERVHVEYFNNRISGSASLPNYCVLVKEGDIYYVKTPTTYSSDRLEVIEKVNLQNAVEFAGEKYGQGYISARWNDYTSSWDTADSETELTPNASSWHANDRNNHVYYTGVAFLDMGYGDVNHIYDNGVANANGYKHTATQKDNETLSIGGNEVLCVVWEYEAYFGEDNWSRARYWFDAETGITLKQASIYPSSANQDLSADENVGFKATYFSKTETLADYLTSIERYPAPDFSSYR